MKGLIRYGNRKLPKATAIFNLHPATGCAGRACGLCQAGADCYALKAERLYPSVLPFRRRQEGYFASRSAAELAAAFIYAVRSKRAPVTALRLQEAGDFRSQAELDKAAEFIDAIKRALDITVYTYSCRVDLDLDVLMSAGAALNLSADSDRFTGANRFKMVRKPSGTLPVCTGDCDTCRACYSNKVNGGAVIEVIKH